MVIQSASFIKSSQDVQHCPKTGLPEYAFLGRSNVGKSSLINYLTNHNKLAKTSGTPGKTRLINHFLINENWFLVDLPGYGYARVSKKEREVFSLIIKEYLLKRENLFNLFLLVDSRHAPQKIDLEIIHWLGMNQIPFVVVLTKTDKISERVLQGNISLLKKELALYWEEFPLMFISSAISKRGAEEILNFIEQTNKNALEKT
ncbi:MAG: YihA family ribosome biogenesis GTP-binding protein [Bacteroidales bacterium]|nr:YihA family ribosome biogenesis GTP-binding protein [Bacteroidales bacterium]